jgi:hypothetical protein
MTPSSNIRSWTVRAVIAPAIALIAMLIAISPLAAAGGSWHRVSTTGLPPLSGNGLCNPLLLTDGTVIAEDCLTPHWYKLTPNEHGDYAKGTWSQIASLPPTPSIDPVPILPIPYGPQWFASAVLPDGRVIVEGGEYDLSCNGTWTWSHRGAIYDPVADHWMPVAPPSGSGWTNTLGCGAYTTGGIGDAPSIVLPNGTFMLGSCCASPTQSALFDALTLTWTPTGAPHGKCNAGPLWCATSGNAFQGEQGYTLLQNDKVLTISVWTPKLAEVYDPNAGSWSSIAPTPLPLGDQCGTYEIGPALGRPDGSVVAFSGHTGCQAIQNAPTAIYTVSTDTWVTGPSVPAECGGEFCTTADVPAAVLPHGNILFAASPFNKGLQPPTRFFEFTSATDKNPNSIERVADPPGASSTAATFYNLLELPNGNIFATDFTNVAKIYGPTGHAPREWKPRITSAPLCVAPGATSMLEGVQLNGLTQGVAYGDDVQAATNYPLVRIVNDSTGHVFYARTFDFSTMSIAPNKAGTTKFTVAPDTELGASRLYVVANGIESEPRGVIVKDVGPCNPRPPPIIGQ